MPKTHVKTLGGAKVNSTTGENVSVYQVTLEDKVAFLKCLVHISSFPEPTFLVSRGVT